jgi:hypothetical protein
MGPPYPAQGREIFFFSASWSTPRVFDFFFCAFNFRGVTKSAPSLYRETYMNFVTPAIREGAIYGTPLIQRRAENQK